MISVNGRGRSVHRVAYSLLGPEPLDDELELDHCRRRGCRYRNCWNPAHLEQVSQAMFEIAQSVGYTREQWSAIKRGDGQL